MRIFHYVLVAWLPASLLAQTPDTVNTTSRIQPSPARTAPPAAVPMTNQEVSQMMNAVGGGSHPGTMVRTIDNRYEGLRGTPYFLNTWLKGQIELMNGKQINDVPAKFNAFRQELVVLRPKIGNDSIIIDRQTVRQFTLTDPRGQTYLFQRYPAANIADADAGGSYFLVLYAGKTALLKRVAKTFQGADYKQPYSTDIRYDSFENKFDYYVLKPDGALKKVKLSRKSLLDALADKRDKLKPVADELSFRTEADAATLVQEYDRL